jgi:hypothetical protein
MASNPTAKAGLWFSASLYLCMFQPSNRRFAKLRVRQQKSHELRMLREQWDTFNPGDIFLGDKGFCSYYDVFKLADIGVDSVITLGRRKRVTSKDADQILGEDDLLIHWPKPKWTKRLSYSKDEWQALPEKLVLRQIKVNVTEPGFRTKAFHIITTLTDSKRYRAKAIAEKIGVKSNITIFMKDLWLIARGPIMNSQNFSVLDSFMQMGYE